MIAALFDLDGTLYNGRIWQILLRYNWAARQNRRWVVAFVVRNMLPMPLYRLGVMSQVAFYRSWGATMSWNLRGWTIGQARAVFEQLTEEQIVPNLRADVVSLLHQHRDQGHEVALVSGTFAPWLELVAQKLGVSSAIGTPLEVRDGRYTGRIVAPLCQGPGKPARVRGYFAREGLEVDWAGSYAYADSGTDLSLFSQIGHPVAVYPDDILLKQAHAEGWPVISSW